jgi:hypothetical protein
MSRDALIQGVERLPLFQTNTVPDRRDLEITTPYSCVRGYDDSQSHNGKALRLHHCGADVTPKKGTAHKGVSYNLFCRLIDTSAEGLTKGVLKYPQRY